MVCRNALTVVLKEQGVPVTFVTASEDISRKGGMCYEEDLE